MAGLDFLTELFLKLSAVVLHFIRCLIIARYLRSWLIDGISFEFVIATADVNSKVSFDFMKLTGFVIADCFN